MLYWTYYAYHRLWVGHSKVASRIHSEIRIAGRFW